MRWLVIVLYVAIIYSTLSIARDIVNSIRSIGILEITTYICVSIFFLILMFSNIKNISKKQILYRIVLIIFFIALVGSVASLPEEKMHIIEYGLLGWLIAWAIGNNKKSKFFYMTLGILLGWIIGWGDEIIQYYLPNRVYDIRDVLLNGLSVTIGFLFFQISKSKG